MSYLMPTAVFVLMVSIGMSLDRREIAAHLRRPHWYFSPHLLMATFILPPVTALVLASAFGLNGSAMLGLFMVGVAPGAPLMTRSMARKGYDPHLAASYQLWCAALTPVMIPLLTAAAGRFYHRHVWIEPTLLLGQIVEKQFLPLLLGVALKHFVPGFSARFQRVLNVAGNAMLTLALVALLAVMGPKLLGVSVWLPVAGALLSAACIAYCRLVVPASQGAGHTLAISNANRHVGLALLLSGQRLHDSHALPAVACYALAAQVVMALYTRYARKGPAETGPPPAGPQMAR